MISVPSPAVAFVGRHNSGKTTLLEKVIGYLVSEGLDVGSIKHHSHVGFSIDIPGKDSYRHRAAGASETVISAPGQVACIKTVEGEKECAELLREMPGHDIVLVEGYRKSGLPTLEIMRQGNEADLRVAQIFFEAAEQGLPLGSDFVQLSHGQSIHEVFSSEESDLENLLSPAALDVIEKIPSSQTVAVITDIPSAQEAARIYGIPCFDLADVAEIGDYVRQNFARPKMSVVIQAGGESKRMGRSKATVPFAGRPLICRIIERVAPVADEVVITTNEPENLEFLFELFPHLSLRLVRDTHEERGALPGLHTALVAAQHPFVAVVACDMVFASPSLIVAETIAMNEKRADAVVPVNKHGYEPFHAVYRKEACLPAVEEALKRNQKRAQSFFFAIKLYEFPQTKVLEVEPMGGCFINANTPEELQAIEDSFTEANHA